mgnify:CR=1 FL=1
MHHARSKMFNLLNKNVQSAAKVQKNLIAQDKAIKKTRKWAFSHFFYVILQNRTY